MIKIKFNPKPVIAAGLMTGTSLDGIDIAICRFTPTASYASKPLCEILVAETLPYPAGFSDFVRNVISAPKWEDVSFLHFAISQLYADAVTDCAEKANIPLNAINVIGMHGQTVWHSPAPRSRFGIKNVKSSIQAGSPATLAKSLGIPVISDFRSADLALGGEGAPLVPRFDFDFFRSETENIVCLNIGGMANITSIPKNADIKKLIAFDTGPGNILINTVVNQYFKVCYDKNGAIASDGKCHHDLLARLMKDPYISLQPPKSTGREYFNMQFIDNILQNMDITPEDIITTLTHFTAESIAENIKKFTGIPDTVFVAGGGIKNIFLIELLQKLLPNTQIKSTDTAGIPSDYKEAIAFAYFAVRTMNNLPSNVPTATGASAETVLGSITF